jgi:hypothetical protein
MTMHRRGAVQSSEVVQFSSSVNALKAQKQSPSVVSLQKQSWPQEGASNPKQSEQGAHSVTYWAKAGVLMLVSMGADQATAAPAPMRLSILLREIRALPSDRMAASPNRWLPSQRPL